MESKTIYRAIGTAGRISVSIDNREKIKASLGQKKYNELLSEALKLRLNNPMYIFYNYYTEKEDYKSISKFFNVSYGHSNENTVSIAGMCVSNDKLNIFKTGVPIEEYSPDVELLTNNTNTNNTKIKKNNKYYINEMKELPKNSLSVIVCNSIKNKSIGDLIGQVTESGWLLNNPNKKTLGSENGIVLLSIKQDELLATLPNILKNFEVSQSLLHFTSKTNVSATLKVRSKSLSKEEAKVEKAVIENLIKSKPKFTVNMYGIGGLFFPAIPFKKIEKNLEFVNSDVTKQSNINNENWDWLKEMTKNESALEEKIDKPVGLKVGEIANIIASGVVNGEISNKGNGLHVVAGGMKHKDFTERIEEEQPSGSIKLIKKRTTYSEPYLNVLINENGKLKIKELGESGDD